MASALSATLPLRRIREESPVTRSISLSDQP
jgi:hypothetical protein